MSVFDPAEDMFGGYSSIDGTIEFYGRINALLWPECVVLDLGAGRGAWSFADPCKERRRARSIKGKVAEYIGADVDPVVLANPVTDRNVMIIDGRIDMPDQSLDLIICDYVLEHILDVTAFVREVERVLRPGGYFCARTPHKYNYVSCVARVVRNGLHARWLRWVQPERKAEDVFPTAYRCNTLRAVRARFPQTKWQSGSYLYTSEPRYYFGRRLLFRVFSMIHKVFPTALTGNLFVFIRRRDYAQSSDGQVRD
jgi:SAM-dependent methyltransferase